MPGADRPVAAPHRQAFGGRDHTTVMHADRKIRQQMAERRSLYNQIAELTNRIKQNT